ncbi:DUF421 domain-containing protein [Thalassorhabdomicrobium marinisediminis]|uniref:DUF421 domain-containing protein n=1 Tax=Thalassorhabdomicrobium marinisediminis TaxID=2170577 RepID=A0A2T7FZF4_9RHOB|nr:YetF domain-containing protein [Thalassorhabdomicrobium marinisediminis]PVA07553.1 DUF421 domain-containing protein [Thalassorhabdomicrobium marinisediminis]
MFTDFLPLDLVLRGLLLSLVALIWVITVVRIVGLRAFSKMTPFDFISTVACGSMLAAAVQSTTWTSYVQAIFGIAGLLAAQVAFAVLRQHSDAATDVMHNTPVILMRNGVINEKALRLTRTARTDLIAKLREANALEIDRVQAVVLETTGDIAVLHGDHFDERLLEGVKTID